MTCHFIPERDKDRFEQFRLRRKVQKVLLPSLQRDSRSKDGGEVLSLSRVVDKKATDIRHGQNLSLRQEALVITVTQDDGLTWTCEEISQYVEGLDAQWYLSCFKGTAPTGDTPEIAHVINLKVFKKEARRVGLLSGSTWSTPLRLVFALLLAIGLTMLANWLLASFTGVRVTEFPPQRLVMLLAAAAAALVASHFSVNHLQEVIRDRNPPENLLKVLHEKRESAAYKKLVALCAHRFVGKKKPRCIIIDDYSRLDFFTQEVLLEASEQNTGIGTILWFILESSVTATLRKRLLLDPTLRRSFCSGNHITYQLLPLTLQERQNVLERIGAPTALASEYRLVKNLTHGTSDEHLPELRELWSNFQIKASQLGLGELVIELAWALALNAYNAPTMEVSELVETLSRERGAFSTAAFLQASELKFTPHETERALKLFQKELPTFFLQRFADDEALSLAGRARYFFTNDQAPGQIPLGLYHLGWFLYWSAKPKYNLDSAYYLDKLAYHARSVKLTEKFVHSMRGEEHASAFLIGAVDLVTRCLKKTLFQAATGVARSLLINLRMLLAHSKATKFREEDIDRFVTTCWGIYLFSKDKDLLRELLDTHHIIRAEKRLIPEGGRTIEQWFWLESMTERIPASLYRIDVAYRHRLSRHATLILSRLSYWLQRFEPMDSLRAVGLPSYEEMAQYLGYDLDFGSEWSLQNRREIDEIIDLHFLGETIFCLKESPQQKRILLDFIDKYIQSAKAIHTYRGGIEEPESDAPSLLELAFVLEHFAICLHALLVACDAISEGGTLPPGSTEFQYLKRRPGNHHDEIEAHVRSIFAALADPQTFQWGPYTPVAASVFEKAEALYGQAALVWEELGLPERRNRMLVRRAQFLLTLSIVHPANPHSYESVTQSLSSALQRDDLEDIIANLILASFFRGFDDICGIYINHAADTSLNSTNHPGLKLLLCKLALTISTSVGLTFINAATHSFKHLDEYQAFGDEALAYIIHRILGAFRIAEDKNMLELALSQAEALLAAPDFAAREELTPIVLYNRLLQNPPHPTDNLNITLEAWEEYRSHFLYSGMLSNLLALALDPRSFAERSVVHLQSRQSPFTSTSDVHLLHATAQVLLKQNIEELKQSCIALFSKAEPTLGLCRIDTCLLNYELLLQLHPANIDDYLWKHARWAEHMVERNRAQALSTLVQQGYIWGIFDNYLRSLRIYGLPTTTLDQEFVASLREARNTDLPGLMIRSRFTSQPVMVIEEGDSVKLVKDFILLGQKLFAASTADFPELERYRKAVNEATRRQLSAFFDLVQTTESIPPYLRTILRQHRQEILHAL